VEAGVKPDSTQLSRLFAMAHRAEFRDAIARPLLKKISAAQGVDLTP